MSVSEAEKAQAIRLRRCLARLKKLISFAEADMRMVDNKEHDFKPGNERDALAAVFIYGKVVASCEKLGGSD